MPSVSPSQSKPVKRPVEPLLRLVRETRGKGYTEGNLYVRGEWFAFVLEDEVRAKKVYGETAIPAGRYSVAATYSPKFRKVTVQILNVPGFEGIRLHQGVHPRHSFGCPLISLRRGGTPGTLAGMRPGILTDELTRLVQEAGGGEIVIEDVPPSTPAP